MLGCLTVVLSCSEMWRHISGSVISDISIEPSVFICRVKEFGFKGSVKQLNFLDFSTLEYDVTTFLPNVGSHWPIQIASYPGRPESFWKRCFVNFQLRKCRRSTLCSQHLITSSFACDANDLSFSVDVCDTQSVAYRNLPSLSRGCQASFLLKRSWIHSWTRRPAALNQVFLGLCHSFPAAANQLQLPSKSSQFIGH